LFLLQALQTESSPYVYYSPDYGYAQSSYNPYNPYIPGAAIGVNGPIIGTQQYFSNPSYPLPVSSPTAYIPVIVQPNSNAVPNIPVAPSVFDTVSSIPSRQASPGSKYSQSRVSSNGGATSQGAASRILKSEFSQIASSEASINVPSDKQSPRLGSVTTSSVTQMTQVLHPLCCELPQIVLSLLLFNPTLFYCVLWILMGCLSFNIHLF